MNFKKYTTEELKARQKIQQKKYNQKTRRFILNFNPDREKSITDYLEKIPNNEKKSFIVQCIKEYARNHDHIEL